MQMSLRKCAYLVCFSAIFLTKSSSIRQQSLKFNNKIGFTRTFMSSTGHQSNSATQPALSKEDELLVEQFREHQKGAARISMAEEVRTLIEQSIGYGVLSTNSVDMPGFPTGSVVGFELGDQGLPFFVFSTMSAHTKDVVKDGKVSLTIMSNDFKGAADGRVVLIGNVVKLVDKEKIVALRDKYLKKHKDAYWIDFGDFSYFTMTSLELVRYVGGFAMAGSINAADYMKASPDPIAPFAKPVLTHMNDDHADSISKMIEHYVKIPNSEATIVSMDRLGMTVKAKLGVAGGGYAKIRLPFLAEVRERKAIKEMLVEMTKASS